MKLEWEEIEKMCRKVLVETLGFNKKYVPEDGISYAAAAVLDTIEEERAKENGLNRFLFTEFVENNYKEGLLDTAESRDKFRNMITLLTSDKDNKMSYNSMMLEVLNRIDRREQELESLKNDIERIIGINKATDKGTDTKLGAYESMNPEERKNIMKLLLEAGADLNKTDTAENKINTKSPEERKDIIKKLLEAGADLNKTDTAEDKTKAKFGDKDYVIKTALKYGADLNQDNIEKKAKNSIVGDPEEEQISLNSKLLLALSSGNQEEARKLLENGADPNCTISSLFPDTALMRICMMKETDPDLIKTAIDCGADPDFKGVAEIDGQRFENPVAGPRDIVKGLHPDIYPQFITYLKEHGYDVNGDELEEIERFEKERDGIE